MELVPQSMPATRVTGTACHPRRGHQDSPRTPLNTCSDRDATPRRSARGPRRRGWQAVPVTRVAGIDCGTNSIRLLVADVDDAGRLTDVDRRMEVVRLGQGVDRTGRIAPEAMERTPSTNSW